MNGFTIMSGSNSHKRGVARVLVVEDNDELRGAICEVLAENLLSISVVAASSCEAALENIRRVPPDVILTDICLPGKNGLVLTEKIKSEFPCIPVIIHTHYNTQEYQEAADALGADLFLIKGKIHLKRLSQLVGEFLD